MDSSIIGGYGEIVPINGGTNLRTSQLTLMPGYTQAEAPPLSGARTSGAVVDEHTDMELYVYTEESKFPVEENR